MEVRVSEAKNGERYKKKLSVSEQLALGCVSGSKRDKTTFGRATGRLDGKNSSARHAARFLKRSASCWLGSVSLKRLFSWREWMMMST